MRKNKKQIINFSLEQILVAYKINMITIDDAIRIIKKNNYKKQYAK